MSEAKNIFDGTWSCRNENYNKILIEAAENCRNEYYNSQSGSVSSLDFVEPLAMANEVVVPYMLDFFKGKFYQQDTNIIRKIIPLICLMS